ncbi:MAG: adenylyl-sulfate kinase [Candidatus Bipolaricaulia bacterium]
MSWAIWITGLPRCGKTARARRVKQLLVEQGIEAKILELDEIRKVITPKPTYSEAEREIVYASLACMAKLLVETGTNVIIDATGNRQRYRDLARSLIPNFIEVYIRCPLEICMDRDSGGDRGSAPENVYEKANAPNATVPGVNVPYEVPTRPEITVDSHLLSVDEAARRIVETIEALFYNNDESTIITEGDNG